MRRFGWILAFVALVASGPVSAAASPPGRDDLTDRIEWVDEFGTPSLDATDDMAADDGSAYATGRVGTGALPGQESAGSADTYVRKYAPDGEAQWTNQFGTAGVDGFTHAVVHDDQVHVFGVTTGEFPGEEALGGLTDLFLARLSADDGTFGDVKQFGTSGFERALAITADDAHLYLLGTTDGAFPSTSNLGGTDFFLAKLTHAGEPVWIEQFGTAENDPAIFTLAGVAVDSDGIYVASSVTTALPGEDDLGLSDGFVRRYDHDGNEVWTEPVGTPCTDLATDIALRGGHLYISGVSVGEISDPDASRCTRPPEEQRDTTGYARAFVQARDLDGNMVWSRQFDGHGINDGDGFSLGITLDVDDDGIYLASEAGRTPTPGTIDQGCPMRGTQEDVHVRAYDFDGEERWTQIIGSTTTDNPSGLAVNPHGVFVGGSTDCHLDEGTNEGRSDAFVLGIRN